MLYNQNLKMKFEELSKSEICSFSSLKNKLKQEYKKNAPTMQTVLNWLYKGYIQDYASSLDSVSNTLFYWPEVKEYIDKNYNPKLAKSRAKRVKV